MASVYQAMNKYVSDEPYYRVGGAFWFVQMWLFVYFPKLLDKDPTSFQTLGLHVVHSLRTMPSDDLMFFFLAVVDQALVHLFFKANSIHISTWNQILAFSQPYLHVFESYTTYANITCRVLISGGCSAFSSLLFASPTSLQSYLPSLWAHQFGFQ